MPRVLAGDTGLLAHCATRRVPVPASTAVLDPRYLVSYLRYHCVAPARRVRATKAYLSGNDRTDRPLLAGPAGLLATPCARRAWM